MSNPPNDHEFDAELRAFIRRRHLAFGVSAGLGGLLMLVLIVGFGVFSWNDGLYFEDYWCGWLWVGLYFCFMSLRAAHSALFGDGIDSEVLWPSEPGGGGPYL